MPATYAPGNVTYVAQWAQNGTGVIEFVYNNGNAATTRTGLGGTSVGSFPTDPVREGYTFAGWFDNAECTGDAVTSLAGVTYVENASLSYYAKWAPNHVALSFEANGGTPAPENVEGNVGESLASTVFPTVSKTGYTLEGWYATDDFTSDKLESLPATFPTADATYYAKWTADAAYIVFHANGGTPAPATLTGVTDGDVTGMSGMPAPVRAGYTLEGWYANAELTGDKVESLPAKYAACTTNYYAKWTPGTVKFTFVANEGTVATTEMTGTVGTAVGNTNLPAAERAGYTLEGWYDNDQFNGTPYGKLPATWPTENKTFYAKWTANEIDRGLRFERHRKQARPERPARGSGKLERQDRPEVHRRVQGRGPAAGGHRGWRLQAGRLVPERRRHRQPAVARRIVRRRFVRRPYRHLLRQVGVQQGEHLHLRRQPGRRNAGRRRDRS